MDAALLKEAVREIERGLGGEFEQISHFVFTHPELGLAEYESSQYLVEYLRGKGFAVQYPYAGFDTAFRAEYGACGPVVAFLAEYDALPGYGPDKANGHACGHNWIAASAVGAGVVLSRMAERLGVRVVVLGTPAEENYCAKVAMVEHGVFNDIDVAMQAHLSGATCICNASLAMTTLTFGFKGRAAHASSAPWDGVNALDAVQLTYAGINALRQHIRPDVRIHGIITDGGRAANIVPESASCLFYVRSATREYLDTLLPKVENVAKGAALMTGAELTINQPELPLDDLVNLPALQELARINFTENGLPPTLSAEAAQAATGSTDLGSVSHVCPTMYVETALADGTPVNAHEESALALVDGPAYETLHRTINAFAGMTVDLCCKPELIAEARAELAEHRS